MSAPVLVAAVFCATLGCGLMAGVFLAFSSFVMSALARLPAPQGIAAMQSVNIRAITPAHCRWRRRRSGKADVNGA